LRASNIAGIERPGRLKQQHVDFVIGHLLTRRSAPARQTSLVIVICEDVFWTFVLVAVLSNDLVFSIADWAEKQICIS
jgi:hypothetical protein